MSFDLRIMNTDCWVRGAVSYMMTFLPDFNSARTPQNKRVTFQNVNLGKKRCHIIRALSPDFDECEENAANDGQLGMAFEWHYAISTSLLIFKQTPEAGISHIGDTLCFLHVCVCVLAHSSTCASVQPGEWIADAKAESL